MSIHRFDGIIETFISFCQRSFGSLRSSVLAMSPAFVAVSAGLYCECCCRQLGLQGICCFQEFFGSCIFPPEGYLFSHCFHQTSLVLAFGLTDSLIGCTVDLVLEGFPNSLQRCQIPEFCCALSLRVSFNSVLTACFFRLTTLRRLGAGIPWGRRLGSFLMFSFERMRRLSAKHMALVTLRSCLSFCLTMT